MFLRFGQIFFDEKSKRKERYIYTYNVLNMCDADIAYIHRGNIFYRMKERAG